MIGKPTLHLTPDNLSILAGIIGLQLPSNAQGGSISLSTAPFHPIVTLEDGTRYGVEESLHFSGTPIAHHRALELLKEALILSARSDDNALWNTAIHDPEAFRQARTLACTLGLMNEISYNPYDGVMKVYKGVDAALIVTGNNITLIADGRMQVPTFRLTPLLSLSRAQLDTLLSNENSTKLTSNLFYGQGGTAFSFFGVLSGDEPNQVTDIAFSIGSARLFMSPRRITPNADKTSYVINVDFGEEGNDSYDIGLGPENRELALHFFERLLDRFNYSLHRISKFDFNAVIKNLADSIDNSTGTKINIRSAY